MGGWTALRVALLLPEIDSVPDLIRAVAPPLVAETLPPQEPAAINPSPHRAKPIEVERVWPPVRSHRAATTKISAAGLVIASAPTTATTTFQEPAAAIPPPLRPTPPASSGSRLAGSAWLLARGGTAGTLSGGRLGGSQAGVRMTYALGAGRRVALSARVATPLGGRGREAAIGLEWRPTDLPVRLVAEQRVALDRGRGGPTLMMIGGIGPTEFGPGLHLESYAQAGAVARGGLEGFADGAARITRTLTLGDLRFDLGAGSWGAVQRDAGRLDLGPTLGVRVPVGPRAIRLTLDWRQRIAGRARPGSGPALSIGSDF